jgi:hypothetical protein
MTGVPMPGRHYTNAAFLSVDAGDPATAQAALEAALAAIQPVLAGLATPVIIQPEVEQGVWVLSQQ